MCPAGGLTTTHAVYIHRVVRADAIQWSVHMKQPGVTTGAFFTVLPVQYIHCKACGTIFS